jgi:hypothetical protein
MHTARIIGARHANGVKMLLGSPSSVNACGQGQTDRQTDRQKLDVDVCVVYRRNLSTSTLLIPPGSTGLHGEGEFTVTTGGITTGYKMFTVLHVPITVLLITVHRPVSEKEGTL